MAGTPVFVPVDVAQARALAGGETLRDLVAFSTTDALLETFGLSRSDDEDAERACLQLASVWGMAHRGTRLVLVGEVQPSSLSTDPLEGHNGGVRLASLSPAQVESFFTDDPSDPLPGTVTAAVRGLEVDEAWERDEVQQLLRTADLLWNGAEELARVGGES